MRTKTKIKKEKPIKKRLIKPAKKKKAQTCTVTANEVCLYGADPGCGWVVMGKVPNSVICVTYNAKSNYIHPSEEEPSAGWFIEPAYTAPVLSGETEGHRCLELYGQFALRGGAPAEVQRPWVSQFDVVTGKMTWTNIAGGEAVSLCLNNGKEDNASGRSKLLITEAGCQILSPVRHQNGPWHELVSADVTGTCPHLVFRVGGKLCKIPCEIVPEK